MWFLKITLIPLAQPPSYTELGSAGPHSIKKCAGSKQVTNSMRFINQMTLFLCGMQIDLKFFSETPVNLSKSELSLSLFWNESPLTRTWTKGVISLACCASEPDSSMWAQSYSPYSKHGSRASEAGAFSTGEELNFLSDQGPAPTPALRLQETAPGAPEGALAALTPHTPFFQMNLNLFLPKSLQKKEKK